MANESTRSGHGAPLSLACEPRYARGSQKIASVTSRSGVWSGTPHPWTQSPMGLICLAIAVEHWNLRCSCRDLSSENICLQWGHLILPSSLIPTCSRVPLPDTASLLISMVSGMAAGAVGQRRVTTSDLWHQSG